MTPIRTLTFEVDSDRVMKYYELHVLMYYDVTIPIEDFVMSRLYIL